MFLGGFTPKGDSSISHFFGRYSAGNMIVAEKGEFQVAGVVKVLKRTVNDLKIRLVIGEIDHRIMVLKFLATQLTSRHKLRALSSKRSHPSASIQMVVLVELDNLAHTILSYKVSIIKALYLLKLT